MTRQPIVPSHRRRRRVGEMAGGTAAECAAVCCCFPCAVLNLVVLAVYRAPAGLFRKVMNKRKRQRLLKENNNRKNDVVLLQPQSPTTVTVGPTLLEEHLVKDAAALEKPEAVALEKEMWARFAGTGFWRSESQRQP